MHRRPQLGMQAKVVEDAGAPACATRATKQTCSKALARSLGRPRQECATKAAYAMLAASCSSHLDGAWDRKKLSKSSDDGPR